MKKLFLIAVLTVGAVTVRAQETSTVIQLSLTPDIAVFPSTTTVRGLSLNIWGENPQWGLTLGLVNGSTGDSGGFSWGVVNYSESYMGVQWGLVNADSGDSVGWQWGGVNLAQGTFKGFQSAVVNVSARTTGLQLGVVNYAQELKGVQIGLINAAMNNPNFTEFPDKLAVGFPLVNWSF